MRSSKTIAAGLAIALLGLGTAAIAQPGHDQGGGEHGGQGHGEQGHGGQSHGEQGHAGQGQARGEAHAGPQGYSRVQAPSGWNNRPGANFDRGHYQHNFQAARAFHVGPYHRPAGWSAHHWGFGQILPRAYFASPYILADYWLFSLEVPPVGYEWVRDDSDALLVNINTGEILQVEYGVFG